MLEVSEPLSITMISDTEENSNKLSHKWDTCGQVEVTQRSGAQGTYRKKEILEWKKSGNNLV